MKLGLAESKPLLDLSLIYVYLIVVDQTDKLISKVLAELDLINKVKVWNLINKVLDLININRVVILYLLLSIPYLLLRQVFARLHGFKP